MHRINNSTARSGSALASACWFLAGALSLATGFFPANPAMAADSVVRCDRPENFGGDAQFRVSQQRGRALIEISKPGTAGRKLEVEYGDELYSQKFGADGTVRLGFALTAAENQFTLTMSETSPVTCTATVPDMNKIFRVILRKDGIGQMDIVGGVPAEDATGEMSYVADATTVPADGVFGFKVDYVTRGSQPEAPYCDDNALATPRIDFIRIEGGKVTAQRLSMNRAKCREKISDSRRLMMIR